MRGSTALCQYGFLNAVDSPRMAVHNKKDIPQTPTTQRKIEEKNLPPKVPRPPTLSGAQPNRGLNYHLPPRPSVSSARDSRVNNQFDNSRDRSKEKLITERDRSKENLQKAGERVVSHGIQRSSSVQKIVYPSWWG